MATTTYRNGQTRAARDSYDDRILRYRLRQRIVHALLAVSFLLLLATGLAILWKPLAHLAAGGLLGTVHRVGAVLFLAVPLLYLLLDPRGAKELLVDSFHYDRDDAEWLKHMLCYALGYAVGMPPQGRLNAGQKLHHAGVVIISATIVLSGLLMWFAKGSLGANGLALTAMVHDLSMLGLTLLLAGHLYFTYVYRALSSMTTGYVLKKDARIEHAKWVEELERAGHPDHGGHSEGSSTEMDAGQLDTGQLRDRPVFGVQWTPCAALKATLLAKNQTNNKATIENQGVDSHV